MIGPGSRRAALVVGVVLAVIAGDWFHIVVPRWTALERARTRLAALRAELDATRREAAVRHETRRAVRMTARALARAEARLPDRRELSGLLAAVAATARDAPLTVLTLRPKPERMGADHVAVPVELELRGTWAETVAFLRGLEGLGRLIQVGALRLDRPRRTGDRVVLAGHATLLTYRLPDARERGATSAARRNAGGDP